MRFEFYHSGLDATAKLSVDGTVSNSIHFSHWEGNQTPAEVKADTSTEIALNLVAAPNRNMLTQGIDLVTNNHFDTDGVLSVWTVLNGPRSLELRDELISAAEAGDFSEFSSEQGVRISIVIQGADQASPNNDSGSPLARMLAGRNVDDDALAYDLVLPEVENLLRHTDRFEPLWLDGWTQISAALDSFESGRSRVEEFPAKDVSVITLAPEIFTESGFSPTRHAPPFTAISHYAKGQLFLIATPAGEGWVYRLDYPYYSWAETVRRPHIERRDLTGALAQLNESEPGSGGRWQPDSREMTSAAKFLRHDGTLGISILGPAQVVKVLSEQAQLSVAGLGR